MATPETDQQARDDGWGERDIQCPACGKLVQNLTIEGYCRTCTDKLERRPSEDDNG